MNSKQFRSNPRFLRNEYPISNEHGIPILQPAQLPQVENFLSYHDTRCNDKRAKEAAYLIHFFKDDNRFAFLYEDNNPRKEQERLKKLAQYAATCTPDFSLYPEMSPTLQQMQVFKSRWCGARWQDMGLCVIPTITWAEKPSYSFCFEGIAVHSTVAVSTVGCVGFKQSFLDGYDKMLEVISPELIICYGDPFAEMDGNIVCFPYSAFRKKASA